MPSLGPLELLMILIPVIVIAVVIRLVVLSDRRSRASGTGGTYVATPKQPSQVIATFGPTTAWVGKRITREDEAFVLEDHGPVTPDAVLEYDRLGQLVWAYDGLREWVERLAASTSPSATGSQTAAVSSRKVGFCPSCGTAIDPSADSFCPACGRAQLPTS